MFVAATVPVKHMNDVETTGRCKHLHLAKGTSGFFLGVESVQLFPWRSVKVLGPSLRKLNESPNPIVRHDADFVNALLV